MPSGAIQIRDIGRAVDELLGRTIGQHGCPRPSISSSSSFELERLLSVRPTGAPASRSLIDGLWCQGGRALFAVHHRAGDVAVLLGRESAREEAGSLHRYISGRFPDCETVAAPAQPLVDAICLLPHGTAVLGVPSRQGAPTDSLIAGLGEGEWLYVVAAEAVSEAQAAASLERYAAESQRLANSFMRTGTVESSNQPLAQSYHELLQSAIELYQEGMREGTWRVRTFLFAEEAAVARAGEAILIASLSGSESRPQPIRCVRCLREMDGFVVHAPCTELPTAALSALCQHPSAEAPGFLIRLPRRFGQNAPEMRGRTIALGRLRSGTGGQENVFPLDVDGLVRHLFISGTTGSGKTETAESILTQLWLTHRVPFLVLEPAKREYRSLLGAPGFEDLLVFTLGDETEAPFRLNPLEVPTGVAVQTHLDLVRTLFRATFAGLYPPLPYLLEQALVEAYCAAGWDLARDVGGCGRKSPTLSDLRAQAERVARRAGYGQELDQNVRAALAVRLDSLLLGGKGHMLNAQRSVDFDELLERPVVLELASIGDPEIVAFLIGSIVVRLYETASRRAPSRVGESPLRHVTLLEEAHRLLAATPTPTSADVSSIQSHGVEALCQLLAEVRAYGEGVIVVDQSPAKLHPDVLRGTNTKLVHRLVAADDRKAAGAATNMTRDQVRALAALRVGEAAYYPEGADQPILIAVDRPDLANRSDLRTSVRAQMDDYYRVCPYLLETRDGEPTDKAVSGRRSEWIEELAHATEVLIATVRPGDLWPALARHFTDALRETDPVHLVVEAEADTQLGALRLGLAVGERLALSEPVQQDYQARLAAALFQQEVSQ